jgi:type III secretion protein W
VKEFFPDPIDAYATLAEIEEALDDSDPQKALLRKAMESLENSNGEQIRSGLSGALGGRDFGDLGSPLDLKCEYVRAVIDFQGPLEMLGNIIERFGNDGFERGLDFLLKSLALDLAAAQPSLDPTRLQAAGKQLGLVRLLNGARAHGQKLVNRWRKIHGQSNSKISAMDFLSMVVSAGKSPYIATNLADPLISLANPPDIEKEVLFRQDLYNTSRDVSPQAFGDLEIRNRCLVALQEGLDQAVAREDAWLAEQEENL